MFCLYCGTSLPDDAMFCNKCGKHQNAGATGSVSSTVPYPQPPVFQTGEQQLAREQGIGPIPELFSVPGSVGVPSRRISRRSLIAIGLAAGVAAVGGAWWLAARLRHPDYLRAMWSATGSLRTIRENHEATLLQNGKVFVTGGMNISTNGYTPISLTELYDSASGIWSATENLRVARAYPTVTVLHDGKVLVTGGWDVSGFSISSVELYDPASGGWLSTTDMTAPRRLHTATLLQDGKVLIVGGFNTSQDANGYQAELLPSVELYDPETNTWSAVGNLGTARMLHTATLLQNGKVLVTGGATGFDFSTATSSAELYDPVSGTWSPAEALKVGRMYQSAILLQDGKVLVVGGMVGRNTLTSTELYDPTSDTWSHTGNMSVRRWLHTATALSDGKVLVVGGNDSFDSGKALSSVEMYDPATNTWTLVAHLITARYLHTSTLLQNGKVLVTGGRDYKDGSLSSTELFG